MEISKTINSGRRSALRKDDKYIHIMKYMGSKRELLPDIREEVESLINEGDGVLDIFAGTASVGVYLRDKFNILSNDIQSYSTVLSDALISSSSKKLSFFPEEALVQLKKHFKKNQSTLQKLYPDTLKESDRFASTVKRTWTDEGRKEYIKFMEEFSSPLNSFKTQNIELADLCEQYLVRGEKPSKSPYLQTTFLFSETYFSFRQCIDIDSLRFAIDKFFVDSIEKNIALSALVYAHSYCSSGTGHFAMFRDLKDVKSINDVFLYRDRDVWSFFEKKFLEITQFHQHYPKRKHLSLSMDFKELLNDKSIGNKYRLIYADPPYSFVHYSRFYHATESLVRYDYMVPEFKGRYRVDRHQSPFCQGQNVKNAFNDLFKSAAENSKIVLLSYADTGMISLDEITELIKKNGSSFRTRAVDYDHSTMGREGHKSNQIKEYLITVFPPVIN